MSRRTGGPVHLLARLLHADHPVDRLIAEVCGGRALERQGAVVPLATPAPAARRARLWVSVAAAAVLLLVAVAARQGLPARETEDGGAETATPDADARLAYLGGRAAFAQGYSDTANQARARADLERAVTRDPGFAAAWAALARVDSAQYRTGMDRDAATLDAAERAARTAVGLDPRLPDGHLALAEIAFSRRDHGRAGRALELIAAMDAPGAWLSPNFRFPAAIAAGDVLDSLGRHEEARSRYVEALATLERRRTDAPDDSKVMAGLGLAYAGLGRADDAVHHAERAVALMPRERDAAEGPLYLYLLARVRARLGHQAEAFAVLDTMFDAPGFYSEAWVQRDPSFVALRADPAYASHLDRWVTRKGAALLPATTAGDVR